MATRGSLLAQEEQAEQQQEGHQCRDGLAQGQLEQQQEEQGQLQQELELVLEVGGLISQYNRIAGEGEGPLGPAALLALPPPAQDGSLTNCIAATLEISLKTSKHGGKCSGGEGGGG